MPETLALVRKLRADDVPAVVSGAGPTVLAFVAASGDLSASCPGGWTHHRLRIEGRGAVVS